MRNKLHSFFALLVMLFCCLSCEKMVTEETTGGTVTEANVVLRVSGFDIVPFDTRSPVTRAAADVAQYCTRLNFVIYDGDKKLKAVSQQADDDGFGQVALKVGAGSYKLLVVAHSSAGNPTLSTPEKVQFTNSDGFSDTFYYYADLTVGDKPQTVDITLQRAVAMFRLVTTDAKPASIRSMRFYYTGGSGALNAVTGFGCVNSQQTVWFDTPDTMDGQPLRLEVYTFPHAQTGTLKLTITSYDAQQSVVHERTFTDVPIERNKVTQYSGLFFEADTPDEPGGEEPTGGASYVVRLNAEWADVVDYGF